MLSTAALTSGQVGKLNFTGTSTCVGGPPTALNSKEHKLICLALLTESVHQVPEHNHRQDPAVTVGGNPTVACSSPASPGRPSPVEPLHFVGTAQELAPLLGQLLQGPPAFVQLLGEGSKVSATPDSGRRARTRGLVA